jgi:hypothetical protein
VLALSQPQSLLECFFWLHGEADGDFRRAVKDLEQLVAQQAAELAFYSVSARQLDPPIARAAIRANDVGFLHGTNMSLTRFDLHIAMRSQSNDRAEMILRRE